jgi:quercetin dioxygenase-like cupin family protein
MTLAAGGAVLDTLPSKRGKKSKQDLGLVVKPQALRVPPLLCYALEPGHEGRKVTKGENNNEDEIGIRINPGFCGRTGNGGGPTAANGEQGFEGRAPIRLRAWQAGSDDFAQRQFRIRQITLEPGGVAGFHSHKERPAFTYIMKGSLTEHRKGGPDRIYKPGEVLVETTDVEHWAENTTAEPVVLISADLFKE